MTKLPNLPARKEDFRFDPKSGRAFFLDIPLQRYHLHEWEKLIQDGPVFAYLDYSDNPHRFIRWTHEPASFYIEETDKQVWLQKATSDDVFDVCLAANGEFSLYDLRKFSLGYAKRTVNHWIMVDPINRGWVANQQPHHFGFAPGVGPIPDEHHEKAWDHGCRLYDQFRQSLKPLTRDWLHEQLAEIKREEDNLPTPYLGERFQWFNGNLEALIKSKAIKQRLRIGRKLPDFFGELAEDFGLPSQDKFPDTFDIPLSRHYLKDSQPVSPARCHVFGNSKLRHILVLGCGKCCSLLPDLE